MVSSRIFFVVLCYLTFAVSATIWISLKYLNDKMGCECRPNVNFDGFPQEGGHGIDGVLRSKRFEHETSTPVTKSTGYGDHRTSQQLPDDKNWGPHKLGLVVPYRDRFEEMLEFVPHMHNYLNAKKVRHKIFIVNQVDKHRFNRASLLNIGFLTARNECDYIVMHDVDLLPLNKDLYYGYPEKGPFHISGPDLHPKYHYKTFVGGILSMSVEQFEKVNGLSNKFWGWGREDDELFMRMVQAGLKVYRHSKNSIKTGYDTFKHDHDPHKRKRDYKRLFQQKKESFKRDRETGLDTVAYKIVKTSELLVNGAPCTLLNVELECDVEVTPWCDNLGK